MEAAAFSDICDASVYRPAFKEYFFVLQPHKLSFYLGQSQRESKGEAARELFSGKHLVFIAQWPI